MAWYVYKCNNQNHPYPNQYSDWRKHFFSGDRPPGDRWGLISVIPDLGDLEAGDMILCYQTDRNELVGVARFTQFAGDEVHLEPIELFEPSVKVRSLKKSDATMTSIRAFSPSARKTLCPISDVDAERVIAAVHAVVGAALAE